MRFLALLDPLADDLHNGDVSRSIASGRTDRMYLSALEFLKQNLSFLRERRLQLAH